MGVIVRTAGSERSKAEIKRDFEYLLRLWDEIRELTLKSTAPALIYEEGNLIKRSIRDLYARDIDEVMVDGDEGYRTAKAFMKMLMPSHAKRVKLYRDPSGAAVPPLSRSRRRSTRSTRRSCSSARAATSSSTRPRRWSRSTSIPAARPRERNIEETALKTNLEAAEEIARQLRLRDLAGLIVIDFIDMEEYRNRGAVERKLKEAMRHDRARIQLGRISPFGLLELSRQRLRPSLVEASTAALPLLQRHRPYPLDRIRRRCTCCARSRRRACGAARPRSRSRCRPKVALYILNQKRVALQQAEARFGFRVTVTSDDTLVPPAFRLDRLRALDAGRNRGAVRPSCRRREPEEEEEDIVIDEEDAVFARRQTASGRAEGRSPSALPPRKAAKPRPSPPFPPRPARRGGGAGARHPRCSEATPHRRPLPARCPSCVSTRAKRPEAVPARESERGEAAADESKPAPSRPPRPGGDAAGASSRSPATPCRPRARPTAETVELVEPASAFDEPAREIEDAFAAVDASTEAEMEIASIPIAGGTESPASRTAPEPAPSPAAAATPVVQYDVPPAHEAATPPANPKRGWWRR